MKTEKNPLKRINEASMQRIVIPTGMTEAGFHVDMEKLKKQGILAISWEGPKNRKSSA